jgi:hypothetical protein
LNKFDENQTGSISPNGNACQEPELLEEQNLLTPPNDSTVRSHFVHREPIYYRLQRLMWSLEAGTGAKFFRISLVVITVLLLTMWIDLHSDHSFSNPEAMESAQLARHLAAWKGYTTFSIRPAALGLLQRADPDGAVLILRDPVPDLSIAPGYPFVLACLMKILPFNFAANRSHLWAFQPELLIVLFNQLLFFASVLIVFLLTRRLFDSRVAWVSSIILIGSETFWKFSLSGLSTMWLLLIFLSLVWCLVKLEQRANLKNSAPTLWSLGLAAAVGALVGLGGLTRYSFAWIIVPAILFVGFYTGARWKRCALLTFISFFVVMAPWIVRNFAISHTPFGTAGYALLQNTKPFEEDRVERSFDPFAADLPLLKPRDILNKFLLNEEKILKTDLPHLGGTWAWSFFLCGLLLPLRHPSLRRLRCFLLWSLAILLIVQPLGQTHLSTDSPEINSENLLVLLAPLILVFGTAFFFTLFDQIALPDPALRRLAAGIFPAVLCAPFLFDLAAPPDLSDLSHYASFPIQRTALMMAPDELMMSDIPWAVAWYGDRPCAWLTLNDADNFSALERLAPVHAIYLTPRTTDRRFLSQLHDGAQNWGSFALNNMSSKAGSPPSQIPANFALTQLRPGSPAEIFLTDKVRWKSQPRS